MRSAPIFLRERPSNKELMKILYGTDKAIEPRQVEQGSGSNLVIIRYMLRPIYARSGINIFIINGPLGAGKSYYAIVGAYHVLRRLKLLKSESYGDGLMEVIDKYMVFTWEELKAKIKEASWRNPWPVLIWDDAGVYGHSYEFFLNKRKAERMSQLFQVIRSRAYNIILTSPSRKVITTGIREIPETILVLMTPVSQWESRAVGYKGKMDPMGKIWPVKKYVDLFYKRVPDEVHNYYMDIRDKYNDIVISLDEEDKEEAEKKRGEKRISFEGIEDERAFSVIWTMCRDPNRWYSAEYISMLTGIPVDTLRHIVYPKLQKHGYIWAKRRYGIMLSYRGRVICHEVLRKQQ